MLHPITLLEASKGKSFGILSEQPDLLYVPRAVAEEAIAEQLNPPAEVAVQPPAEVQPAVLAHDVRYRTSCKISLVYNVTLVGLFMSLVC